MMRVFVSVVDSASTVSVLNPSRLVPVSVSGIPSLARNQVVSIVMAAACGVDELPSRSEDVYGLVVALGRSEEVASPLAVVPIEWLVMVSGRTRDEF